MRQPGEHAVEPFARIARASGDAEPRELEHRLRLLPAREVEELVGADEEHRVAPRALTEHVDRTRVVVEHDLVRREGEPRELEPRLGRGVDVLVARVGDDDDHDPLEAELPLRRVRQRDVAVVRRVERAAEEADHSLSTSVSSPTSTSVPFRAPAARSAASSSSAGGGSPVTRKPAVGAEDPVG